MYLPLKLLHIAAAITFLGKLSDAFAGRLVAANPAAVVVTEKWLPDPVLQARGTLRCLLLALLVIRFGAPGAQTAAGDVEPVVLLHGLGRSSYSMAPMAEALEAAHYRVCNIAYPSREHTVEVLAADFVLPRIEACIGEYRGAVSFVTHSVGGIIVRQLSASGAFTEFGRVVMLSPPNQGSEVVDRFGGLWLFEAIYGPAGFELGTNAESLPLRLGPAHFEVGIITGTRSINPVFSLLVIPGADDGKVAVDHARLEGMTDFLAVPVSHPFIMKSVLVIEQTLHFLRYGSFTHEPT